MTDFDTHTIAATIHGRYLVRRGAAENLLVGFHGYAENASMHLGELTQIPGSERWTLVAVQGLNRFYAGRSQIVVASWMTREDRELAIADNIDYVRGVVAQFPSARRIVFAGFSQGAAMAYRAAAAIPAAGVIALGGDLPPDVIAATLPPVLIGRGIRDEWYTDEKLKQDMSYLPGATAKVFDGGHEWNDEFRAAAGEFLARMTGQDVDESVG
jgi:predicted esterase